MLQVTERMRCRVRAEAQLFFQALRSQGACSFPCPCVFPLPSAPLLFPV